MNGTVTVYEVLLLHTHTLMHALEFVYLHNEKYISTLKHSATLLIFLHHFVDKSIRSNKSACLKNKHIL